MHLPTFSQTTSRFSKPLQLLFSLLLVFPAVLPHDQPAVFNKFRILWLQKKKPFALSASLFMKPFNFYILITLDHLVRVEKYGN